jgi:hypothetical protein
MTKNRAAVRPGSRASARALLGVPCVVAGTIAAALLVGRAGDPPADCPAGGTTLRWETFARPFFQENCGACHSWSPYTTVYLNRNIILQMVWSGLMPAGGPLPQTDRDQLAEWMACDLPYDLPACPPGGTALDWTTFGQGFVSNYCLSCHSAAVTGPDRNGAPEGVDFDEYPAVKALGARIVERALKAQMPPGGGVGPGDLDSLSQWAACGFSETATAFPYRRGDPNGDGKMDLSDAVSLIHYLFQSGAEPGCLDSGDVNGNGGLDLTDIVYILEFLYMGGVAPPPPFDECDWFLTLGCRSFQGC